jgi:hypothetical protein
MSRHAKDEETDAQHLADQFDALVRQSEQRAAGKRETRTYPYDLEESQ